MFKSKIYLGLACTLIIKAASAYAEITKTTDTVVVTATKEAKSKSELAESVSVIGSDEIDFVAPAHPAEPQPGRARPNRRSPEPARGPQGHTPGPSARREAQAGRERADERPRGARPALGRERQPTPAAGRARRSPRDWPRPGR